MKDNKLLETMHIYLSFLQRNEITNLEKGLDKLKSEV